MRASTGTGFVVLLVATGVFAEANHAEATTGRTVPTAGGYSNDLTVGIVTQVEKGAYVERSSAPGTKPLRAGDGLFKNDRVWVEPEALMRVGDTSGGRFTVSGPAVIEFKADGILLYRGAVKMRSAMGRAIFFAHPLVAGKVTGDAAVWVADVEVASAAETGAEVQLVSLAGEIEAWHPTLAAVKVVVPPGSFVEASSRGKRLGPGRPEQVDGSRLQAFMARFERSTEDRLDAGSAVDRGIASMGLKQQPSDLKGLAATRGSRSQSDVIESVGVGTGDRLRAHIAGRDFEDDDDDDQADAYGRAARGLRTPARWKGVGKAKDGAAWTQETRRN